MNMPPKLEHPINLDTLSACETLNGLPTNRNTQHMSSKIDLIPRSKYTAETSTSQQKWRWRHEHGTHK